MHGLVGGFAPSASALTFIGYLRTSTEYLGTYLPTHLPRYLRYAALIMQLQDAEKNARTRFNTMDVVCLVDLGLRP